MPKTMSRTVRTLAGATLALSLGLTLTACGGMPNNRSLESVHQPVVERTNYTMDVTTGPGGLSLPEQRRVAGWFEAMDLRYGDRIAIDDPLASNATLAAVEALAGRYGILLSGEAPVTPGYVNPGTVRIVVTRSKATVAGCPDWHGKTDFNPGNATSRNYGCAVNSNLASMVADPEHLIEGASSQGNTVVMSSNKAIDTYREAKPTGSGDLKASSTSSGK